jgi:hypothetical protein
MNGKPSGGDGRVDHFFPLYVRDFLTSTIGWTAEERGHYLTLLMISWDRGGLPTDLPALERLSPGVTVCWGLLEGKFPVAGDGLRRNSRLEGHREKALDIRRKRSEAGAKGAQAKAKQLPGICQANGSARFSQTADNRSEAGNDRQPVIAESQQKPPISLPTVTKPPIVTAIAQQLPSKPAAKVKHPEPEPHCNSGEVVDALPALGTGAPPRPSTASRGSIDAGAWARLLQAWNAGTGQQWPSKRPPPEAVKALTEPDWLEVAFRAIDRLPRCKYFRTPPDLSQFCSPGFAEKIDGGRYDQRFDEKGAPTAGQEEARARKEEKRLAMVSDYARSKEEKRLARLEEEQQGVMNGSAN